jgi:hypothetical protein
MNDAFDTYREQSVRTPERSVGTLLKLYAHKRYYEGGISSVYLWDLEDGGFAGAVLLKKSKVTPAMSIYFMCSQSNPSRQRCRRMRPIKDHGIPSTSLRLASVADKLVTRSHRQSCCG